MRAAAPVDFERQGFQAGDERRANKAAGLLLTDVDVVSALGLRRGREDRLWQPVGFAEAGGELDAAHAACLLVFLPPRSREVAAGDALHLHRIGAAHEHRPAAQGVGVWREGRGKFAHVGAEQVMRHEVTHALEPERRELREDLALVGDAGAEHVVERRDAIGRDDQQVVADFVHVANLAAAMQGESRERGFEEWGSSRHRKLIAEILGAEW